MSLPWSPSHIVETVDGVEYTLPRVIELPNKGGDYTYQRVDPKTGKGVWCCSTSGVSVYYYAPLNDPKNGEVLA